MSGGSLGELGEDMMAPLACELLLLHVGMGKEQGCWLGCSFYSFLPGGLLRSDMKHAGTRVSLPRWYGAGAWSAEDNLVHAQEDAWASILAWGMSYAS